MLRRHVIKGGVHISVRKEINTFQFIFPNLNYFFIILLNRSMVRVTWDSYSCCEGTVQN